MNPHDLLPRIANGRTDFVVDFIDAGGTASATDTDGVRLIQWCAYFGDVSALRYLLRQGERLHTLGDDLGLNAAAFHGHWQLCQFLIEQGASANCALPKSAETPLHSALCSDDRVRYDPVVSVLLAAGADVHATTRAGAETGSFMRDCRTRGETPLHRAAAFGSEATIQLLLDAGAKRDAKDAHGDTPLSWAGWHRRPVEIIRLLCFGSFSVHPQYRSLRQHLVGAP